MYIYCLEARKQRLCWYIVMNRSNHFTVTVTGHGVCIIIIYIVVCIMIYMFYSIYDNLFLYQL